MNPRTYQAIRIVQKPDATPFYVLGVNAPEILEWADVPRKKSTYMAGYQRELDDRHKKLTEFLRQDAKNIIPGAVIVAVAGSAVRVEEVDDNFVQLTISHDEKTTEELLKDLYKQFHDRLSESELNSIASIPLDDDGSEAEEETDEDDDTAPESYLARLTAELKLALDKGLESLSEDRRNAIEEYLRETSKPGLILDGQHRVFASKNIDEYDVKLPVVVMPDLATSEQVFHFYVLNNKAKPLKPTELRSTISTSLSNDEIDGLYERLKTSGVKSDEARWTHLINTDEKSPFKQLVDFGFREATGFIPENVIFQVAKKFMKPPKRFALLFKDVESWNDDKSRLELFFALWDAVKAKYPQAWQNGIDNKENRQIFYKATMFCTLDLLFESLTKGMPKKAMKNEPSPFSDIEELKEEVSAALHFLPQDFFTKEWQETGLDTKERRDFLKGQMEQAINKQGEKLGTIQLFRKNKNSNEH